MKTLVLSVLICLMPMLSGCAGCRREISHFKSNVFGLTREATLYSNDGKPIKTWKFDGQVEDKGGSFRFLVDGKAITIAGTVVIEEK